MSDNRQSEKHGTVTLGLVGLFAFVAGTVFSGEIKTNTETPVISTFAENPGEVQWRFQNTYEAEDSEATIGEVYYSNCSAARAAGADPVRYGDAGYASHLDRDGDGVGCE